MHRVRYAPGGERSREEDTWEATRLIHLSMLCRLSETLVGVGNQLY